MNLIDENSKTKKDNKKILLFGGIAVVILLFIIVGLLALVTTLGKNNTSLVVDGKKYTASDYLLSKENVVYIGIEDLTKLTNNGYSYKSGGIDVEDENQCYVTNSYESTFFQVNSNQIYKILEDTEEVEYYTLDKPIIKENGKIYMPINASKIAMNTAYSNTNNQYTITSIAWLESDYNKQKTNSFNPDSSIVWQTIYSNKKMLKDYLVITKDSEGKLGVAKISKNTDSKSKVTTVSTTAIITPKYDYIKYVEKYNQLIVETDGKKGIVQISQENENFSVKTLIKPQYEEIVQMKEDLFVVSQTNADRTKSYGIVQASNGEEKQILPIEYEGIGIDISLFTDNNLDNKYIIYDNLIPVKKNGLWGFANLKGNIVIKLEYTGLGCVGTNSNTNTLIIPEIEGIVVQKDNNYGVISKSNRVLIRNILSRVYRETVNGKKQYSMVLNDRKYNVIDYVNNN